MIRTFLNQMGAFILFGTLLVILALFTYWANRRIEERYTPQHVAIYEDDEIGDDGVEIMVKQATVIDNLKKKKC